MLTLTIRGVEILAMLVAGVYIKSHEKRADSHHVIRRLPDAGRHRSSRPTGYIGLLGASSQCVDGALHIRQLRHHAQPHQ